MTANEGTPVSLLVDNICKRFGSLEVLKGVSLTAHENDVITLLGASGSGKSTLLRCINLLDTPDSGKVYVRGELIEMSTDRHGNAVPTNSRQVSRIRSRLGMVFQQFNLWSHLTVLQSVIEAPIHVLGLQRREAIDRAQELLDKVGLSDKLDSYPSHLSGGQEQRAAIARALAMEPDLILFDEPTSALAPELVGEVLKVIQNLASEGCTMLIVTHELSFARDVSSQTVFLDQGRIEEQGSPDNVLDNPQSERLKRFLSGNYRRAI